MKNIVIIVILALLIGIASADFSATITGNGMNAAITSNIPGTGVQGAGSQGISFATATIGNMPMATATSKDTMTQSFEANALTGKSLSLTSFPTTSYARLYTAAPYNKPEHQIKNLNVVIKQTTGNAMTVNDLVQAYQQDGGYWNNAHKLYGGNGKIVQPYIKINYVDGTVLWANIQTRDAGLLYRNAGRTPVNLAAPDAWATISFAKLPAGIGGTTHIWARQGDGVIVDTDTLITNWFNDRGILHNIMGHELGHTLGAADVNNPAQLMNYKIWTNGDQQLGSGDKLFVARTYGKGGLYPRL